MLEPQVGPIEEINDKKAVSSLYSGCKEIQSYSSPFGHISYMYLSHKVVIFSQRNTVEPALQPPRFIRSPCYYSERPYSFDPNVKIT